MSDYMSETPLLKSVTAKDDDSHFLRESQELTGQARPRTFGAYMGQRQQGGRTRLQELRAKHGWSLFRSKNSEGGRAYRDALRAEKWRFTGGGARVEARLALGEDGRVSDPGLARSYRAMKSGLKAAAGWRRFIPFTAARRDYKAALKSLRTGEGMDGQPTGNGAKLELTPFGRLFNTSRFQRTLDQAFGRDWSRANRENVENEFEGQNLMDMVNKIDLEQESDQGQEDEHQDDTEQVGKSKEIEPNGGEEGSEQEVEEEVDEAELERRRRSIEKVIGNDSTQKYKRHREKWWAKHGVDIRARDAENAKLAGKAEQTPVPDSENLPELYGRDQEESRDSEPKANGEFQNFLMGLMRQNDGTTEEWSTPR